LKYDEIDIKILGLISKNSRLSVREISKIINISPPTVSRRIRKLEEKGVIKGYVSIIEDEELGYDCRALLLIKIAGNSDQYKIIEKMRENLKIKHFFTKLMIVRFYFSSKIQYHGLVELYRSSTNFYSEFTLLSFSSNFKDACKPALIVGSGLFFVIRPSMIMVSS
jgi:DNA-binding Lrp family transcriptional regulator